MTQFLILSWPTDCAQSDTAAQKVRAKVDALRPDWRLLLDEPGRLVAAQAGGRATKGYGGNQPTFVLGDVFPSGQPVSNEPRIEAREFLELCRDLTQYFWGAYLAVQLREDRAFSVFRDPIGMRDAVTWSHSNLRIVASDAVPWLVLAAPDGLAVDWGRVGELLCSSSTVAEATPLAGVETIAPGTLIDFRDGKNHSRRLWEPRHFYDGDGVPISAEELAGVANRCIDAWATTYPTHIMEISGGFDSAVIAAVATEAGHRAKYGVNFFADEFAGDERRYARDVAHLHGIALHEIFMPVGVLSDTDLDDMPIGVRPGLGSTSLVHDRLLAAFAATKGTDALFTGHGGDAIFFQHPTLAIAADRSFPRRKIEAYVDLARWTKSSVWSVARHAFRIGSGSSQKQGDMEVASLPLAAGLRAQDSTWAGDPDGLPPAKALHIDAIAVDRGAFGPSWRSQALTVVHPLLSQPLVELAIATDPYHLTYGRRDRALARDAFQHLLPASIAERRGKGAVGPYIGRLLAASSVFLRSYLLDGQLVRKGLIDAGRLEPMLDRDFLMRVDCYGGLLSALLMEQWARVWVDRLEAFGQDRSATVSQSSDRAS